MVVHDSLFLSWSFYLVDFLPWCQGSLKWFPSCWRWGTFLDRMAVWCLPAVALTLPSGVDCWAGLSQQPLPSRDVRDFSAATFGYILEYWGHYLLSNKSFVLLEHKVLKGTLQRRLVQAENMEKCRTMTFFFRKSHNFDILTGTDTSLWPNMWLKLSDHITAVWADGACSLKLYLTTTPRSHYMLWGQAKSATDGVLQVSDIKQRCSEAWGWSLMSFRQNWSLTYKYCYCLLQGFKANRLSKPLSSLSHRSDLFRPTSSSVWSLHGKSKKM